VLNLSILYKPPAGSEINTQSTGREIGGNQDEGKIFLSFVFTAFYYVVCCGEVWYDVIIIITTIYMAQ